MKSKDATGNLATSGDYTFTTSDDAAPVISAVASPSVSATAATITWTTNEASDTQIEYGPTTSYGSSTTINSSLVTSHSQSLTGLTAGTTYHFRVKSADSAGNATVSGDYSFATASTEVDINSGLAAAFAFDEGAGYVSADLSGNGNDASIVKASWTTGKYGKALSFNGTNNYVTAGIAGMPAVNAPKTISAWIYLLTKPRTNQSMLALANVAAKASVHYSYKSTQAGVLGYGDTWIVASRLPSIKQWHHFAYVYDGSQNRLYVDGVLTSTSTIMPAAAEIANFEIGRWVTGTEYFKGSIDDVRVYNRALNMDELKAVMNTPVGGASAQAGAPEAAVAESLLSPEESAAVAEASLPPDADPAVDVELEKRIYRQGETVTVKSFRVSNPSTTSREVELKSWMALPGMLPVSLDVSLEDKMHLEAGFSQDFGSMPLLQISKDAPSGTGEVNARLIDPVTGAVLSEDINDFTIGILKKSAALRETETLKPEVTLVELAADSRPQYLVTNVGSMPVTVELKIWLEFADGAAVPVISVGAGGSLALEPGANLAMDPLASVRLPVGDYAIRARLLDAASGRILSETASN